MERMKKLFSLLLALTMVLSLATAAFAAEGDPVITVPDDGHTYEVYQIFTGDLAELEGKKVLSNVKWGTNGTGTTGETVAETVLDALAAVAGSTDDEAKLAVINQYVNLSSTPITIGTIETESGETKVLTAEVAPGYYLIKDQDGSIEGHDAYTSYIVEIVDSVTISRKADVPTVEKKVFDTNDTTGSDEVREDSADHDIGDDVKFQITGTLADNVTSYESYKVVFHDTMDAGLTLNATYVKDDEEDTTTVATGVTVTVDGKDKTSAFTITAVTGTDGKTALTVSCDDVKAAAVGATNESQIVITYTAKLNKNAQLGAAGNYNKVYLEYSNDPNWTAEGEPGTPPPPPPTGETPEDKVVVFTYQVVANKVDEDAEPLVGATFTLFKQVEEPTGTEGTDYITETTGEGDAAQTIYWQNLGAVSGTQLTTFTWTGIDDGTYKLVETVTPAGYNTIDPIVFEVEATHDESSVDPHLTELDGGTFTGNVTAGTLSADIVNKPGTVLPETGGMGTTLIYIIGGIMVLAAVVLLVTKKRMASAE